MKIEKAVCYHVHADKADKDSQPVRENLIKLFCKLPQGFWERRGDGYTNSISKVWLNKALHSGPSLLEEAKCRYLLGRIKVFQRSSLGIFNFFKEWKGLPLYDLNYVYSPILTGNRRLCLTVTLFVFVSERSCLLHHTLIKMISCQHAWAIENTNWPWCVLKMFSYWICCF